MSENKLAKQALKEKYQKEIEHNLDDLKKKQAPPQPARGEAFEKVEEVRLTIELIKYLTAELANTKAELFLLKKSMKESR